MIVQPGGYSSTLALSEDGRYVAFVSDATNLTSDQVSGFNHVFIHDRVTNKTTLVSRSTNGSPIQGEYPALAANGRTIVFVTDDCDPNRCLYLAQQEAVPPSAISVTALGAP